MSGYNALNRSLHRGGGWLKVLDGRGHRPLLWLMALSLAMLVLTSFRSVRLTGRLGEPQNAAGSQLGELDTTRLSLRRGQHVPVVGDTGSVVEPYEVQRALSLPEKHLTSSLPKFEVGPLSTSYIEDFNCTVCTQDPELISKWPWTPSYGEYEPLLDDAPIAGWGNVARRWMPATVDETDIFSGEQTGSSWSSPGSRIKSSTPYMSFFQERGRWYGVFPISDNLDTLRHYPSWLLGESTDGLKWRAVKPIPDLQRTPTVCVTPNEDPATRGEYAYLVGTSEERHLGGVVVSHFNLDTLAVQALWGGSSWNSPEWQEYQLADTANCLQYVPEWKSFAGFSRYTWPSRDHNNYKFARGFGLYTAPNLTKPLFSPHQRWLYDREQLDSIRRALYSVTSPIRVGRVWLTIVNNLYFARDRVPPSSMTGGYFQSHWATSRDGIHWDLSTVYAQVPVVPPPTCGSSYYRSSTYFANNLVHADHAITGYFNTKPGNHQHFRLAPGTLRRAVWNDRRLAALEVADAWQVLATVDSKEFPAPASGVVRVRLEAELSSPLSGLRVSVVAADGTLLRDSSIISGGTQDDTGRQLRDAAVEWTTQESEIPPGKPIHLRFDFTTGVRLFGFTLLES